MVACRLATYFVLSKDLVLLKMELNEMGTSNTTEIGRHIDRFSSSTNLQGKSAYARLEILNKCFSNITVEEILLALEKEIIEYDGENWKTEQ